MNFKEIAENRQSCRAYDAERAVEEEKLSEILKAGTFAATGRGRQSPIMVVVQDQETREILRRMNAEIMGTPDADPFYGAPTIVIVLADRTIPTYLEDGSLVMGNLMNAAFSLGVDSCWIHRARQMFDSDEGKALLKAWGLPETMKGVGNCILGYPAQEPAAKPRKEGRIVKVK